MMVCADHVSDAKLKTTIGRGVSRKTIDRDQSSGMEQSEGGSSLGRVSPEKLCVRTNNYGVKMLVPKKKRSLKRVQITPVPQSNQSHDPPATVHVAEDGGLQSTSLHLDVGNPILPKFVRPDKLPFARKEVESNGLQCASAFTPQQEFAAGDQVPDIGNDEHAAKEDVTQSCDAGLVDALNMDSHGGGGEGIVSDNVVHDAADQNVVGDSYDVNNNNSQGVIQESNGDRACESSHGELETSSERVMSDSADATEESDGGHPNGDDNVEGGNSGVNDGIEVNYPALNSRSSPSGLYKAMHDMNEVQKTEIKAIGFEWIPKLGISKIDTSIAYWLVDNFDTASMSLKLPDGKKLKITEDDIEATMGIPRGPLKIRTKEVSKISLRCLNGGLSLVPKVRRSTLAKFT